MPLGPALSTASLYWHTQFFDGIYATRLLIVSIFFLRKRSNGNAASRRHWRRHVARPISSRFYAWRSHGATLIPAGTMGFDVVITCRQAMPRLYFRPISLALPDLIVCLGEFAALLATRKRPTAQRALYFGSFLRAGRLILLLCHPLSASLATDEQPSWAGVPFDFCAGLSVCGGSRTAKRVARLRPPAKKADPRYAADQT